MREKSGSKQGGRTKSAASCIPANFSFQLLCHDPMVSKSPICRFRRGTLAVAAMRCTIPTNLAIAGCITPYALPIGGRGRSIQLWEQRIACWMPAGATNLSSGQDTSFSVLLGGLQVDVGFPTRVLRPEKRIRPEKINSGKAGPGRLNLPAWKPLLDLTKRFQAISRESAGLKVSYCCTLWRPCDGVRVPSRLFAVIC